MEQRSVIVGIGHTSYGAHPGRSTISLKVEAVQRALQDAGIAKDRIDGLFVKYPTSRFESLYAVKVAEALGLEQLHICGGWDQGGAANISQIALADQAIRSGQCEVAVVCFADNPKSGSNWAYSRARNEADEKYGWLGTAAYFALFAQRHMALHGTTAEDLGRIAVQIRAHGAQNPNAQLRKALTLDDYLSRPFMVEPLRRDDMALISDGGAAIVITSQKVAEQMGGTLPVAVLGYGQAINATTREDLTTTGAQASAQRAFSMAGLTPRDVQLAQLYDCFTPTVLVTLEDYGFCKKGQAGHFIREEGIGIGGRLPLNTSGGLLSETGMPGMQLIIEAVRQLRGTANLQVKSASNAVVSGWGGAMQTHSTLILGT